MAKFVQLLRTAISGAMALHTHCYRFKYILQLRDCKIFRKISYAISRLILKPHRVLSNESQIYC